MLTLVRPCISRAMYPMRLASQRAVRTVRQANKITVVRVPHRYISRPWYPEPPPMYDMYDQIEPDDVDTVFESKDTQPKETVLAWLISPLGSAVPLTTLKAILRHHSSGVRHKLHVQRTRRRKAQFIHLRITKENGLTRDTPNALACFIWDGYDKEFFFFEEGLAVGWGVSKDDQDSIQGMFTPSEKGLFRVTESMTFKYGDTAGIDAEKDILILTRNNEWQERVAFSLGLTRSVLLDQFQQDLEHATHRAMNMDEIKQGFSSKQDGKKWYSPSHKELTHLYHLRYQMQNRFRVLESPSWLWDKPESLSNLFNEITRYLEVSDRASKLLTDQLQFPMSYWELESSYDIAKKSRKLEILIVILISIEVLIQIFERGADWFQTWKRLGSQMYRKIFPREEETPFGDEYEIVEEVYEVITPKKA